MSDYLFTSESVSEGHPDKIADYISDRILDAILAQDPKARVAAETMVTTGLVVLAGEITTCAHVNYTEVARQAILKLAITMRVWDFVQQTVLSWFVMISNHRIFHRALMSRPILAGN